MKFYDKLVDIIILFFIVIISSTDASCSFPSEISGVWYSAHKGALTFNDTHLTGYPIYMSVAVQSLNFSCEESSGDYYMLKATETAFIFNNDIRAYLCLYLKRISEYKYYYQLGTTVDPTNNDHIKGTLEGSTVVMSDVCNRATPYEASTYIVLVKDGSPASGMGEATCSNALLANYGSVSITDASGTSCTSTTFDGCTVKTGHTYTYDGGCSTIPFSSSGNFVCMRSVTSNGYSYLSVWNNDTSVATGDYQFSCLVISQSSSGLTAYATEVPNYCSDTTQTSTALPSGATEGNIYVFSSQTESCATSVEGQSNAVFYATIFLGSLTLIAVTVLIVVLLKTKGCPKCCCPPCSCCRSCPSCPSCTCFRCKSCKRNKVGDSGEHDPESGEYPQEDGRPDDVANTIFRLPPFDAFKPKRPIPIGPVVEASIMPLPKVEPLYARYTDNRIKRTASMRSIGSIFSFKMKF